MQQFYELTSEVNNEIVYQTWYTLIVTYSSQCTCTCISSFFFNFLPVSSPDALSVGRSQQYWSGYRYDFTPPLNVYRIARRFVLVLV